MTVFFSSPVATLPSSLLTRASPPLTPLPGGGDFVAGLFHPSFHFDTPHQQIEIRAQKTNGFSCFFYCFEKKREEYLVHQKKSCNFAGAKKKRKVGRVIDRAGLEIRYTLFGYRGFESLTFRKERRSRKGFLLFFYVSMK